MFLTKVLSGNQGAWVCSSFSFQPSCSERSMLSAKASASGDLFALAVVVDRL